MSVRLTHRPLSFSAAIGALERPGLGGIVVFAGRVRADRSPRGSVTALEYEAHRPLALRALGELERTARARFGAERVVLWHRLGTVPVDEVSVIVGAAAPHRAEAFAATRFLIERLKATAPIWKTEQGRRGRRPRRLPGEPVSR